MFVPTMKIPLSHVLGAEADPEIERRLWKAWVLRSSTSGANGDRRAAARGGGVHAVAARVASASCRGAHDPAGTAGRQGLQVRSHSVQEPRGADAAAESWEVESRWMPSEPRSGAVGLVLMRAAWISSFRTPADSGGLLV